MPQVPSVAVIGLGYVGLPLALEASRAGMVVTGFDTSLPTVRELNAGHSHVGDIAAADVREMVEGGFRATTDVESIREASTFVICVPTPLSDEGGPDLTAVRAAGRSVATVLSPGDLVVLESTTYPGTTEEVLAPILETSGLTRASTSISPSRPNASTRATGSTASATHRRSSAASTRRARSRPWTSTP